MLDVLSFQQYRNQKDELETAPIAVKSPQATAKFLDQAQPGLINHGQSHVQQEERGELGTVRAWIKRWICCAPHSVPGLWRLTRLMLFFFVCTTSPLFSAIIIIITTTTTTSIIIIILIQALFECCLAQATGIKRKKYAVAASAMSKRPVRRGGWNHWGT